MLRKIKEWQSIQSGAQSLIAAATLVASVAVSAELTTAHAQTFNFNPPASHFNPAPPRLDEFTVRGLQRNPVQLLHFRSTGHKLERCSRHEIRLWDRRYYDRNNRKVFEGGRWDGGAHFRVLRGTTSPWIYVERNRFSWQCGGEREWVTMPSGTNWVRVDHTGRDRKVRFHGASIICSSADRQFGGGAACTFSQAPLDENLRPR